MARFLQVFAGTGALVLSVVAVLDFVAPAHAASCAGGAAPLVHSGLCPEAAVRLMPEPDPSFVMGLELFECRAVPSDGRMLGNIIIYYGAQCQGIPTVLEGAIGARSGSIDVLGGGMNPDTLESSYSAARIVGAPADDPTADMLRWARTSMEADGLGPAERDQCVARKMDDWGTDVWVIDNPLQAQTAPADEPRSACGFYGYTEESNAYWRIAHGMAMHFDMGQDAYQDFDPKSLTMIEQDAQGQWIEVDDVAAQAERQRDALIASGDHGVTNIAGKDRASETAYGEARGWTIYAGAVDGQTRYCAGEIDVDGIPLRLGYDRVQWQIALPSRSEGDRMTGFEVDGQSWGMTGTQTGQWIFGWIGLPELDAIRNGNLLILDVGRASFDAPLAGSAATITKIEECLANAG